MPDELTETVRRLAAESAIRDVLSRYARGVDRCDWSLLRSCYHDDARHQRGDYAGTADETVAWIRGIRETVLNSWHLVGNPLIEFDDGGEAAAVETYCLAIQRLPGPDGQPLLDRVTPCRYLDRFTRVDGVWRIARRVGAYEPAQELPVSADVAAPGSWSPAGG